MKNTILKNTLFSCFAVLLFLCSCKKEEIKNDGKPSEATQNEDVLANISTPDSVKIKPVETSAPPAQNENGFYNALALPKDKKKRDSVYAEFSKKFNERERYAILALNRLDSKSKWNSDTLIVPVKIDTTLMSYSPFPLQLDFLSDVKKLVTFSYPLQAYAVYSNGALVKWGPTSMGKKSAQTDRGLMFANWKKKLAISTVKSEWKLPYNFNIHNTHGIGWHEYDLPGYPASHSCLRLLKSDAIWLYNYAETWVLNPGGATTKAKGTPVIVFGDYPWGKRKPWRKLLDDPNANNISVEEMRKIVEPHLEKMMFEQGNREKVVDSINTAKEQKVAAKEPEFSDF